MSNVVRFVRQLSHDLRNHLNAAELQSAYLGEIVTDAEPKEEVLRLRAMLGEMGTSLQKLTNSIAQVKLTTMPYEASALTEDLRKKVDATFPETRHAVQWEERASDAPIESDPQILQEALLELFANAFLHERGEGPVVATATTDQTHFTFTLREPKKKFETSTENWGREPFGKTKHGHYGLGLPRVRSIIEAHGGTFAARYDNQTSELVTTVSLPLNPA